MKNQSSNLAEYFGELFPVPVPASRKRKPLPDNQESPPKKKTFGDEVTQNINESLLRDTCRLQDTVTNLQRELRQQTAKSTELEQRQKQLLDERTQFKDKEAAAGCKRWLNEKIKRKSTQASRWRTLYTKANRQNRCIQEMEETIKKLKEEKSKLQKICRKERRKGGLIERRETDEDT